MASGVLCSVSERGGAPMGPYHHGGDVMAKLGTVLLILASFLLVAPVIESGTLESTQFFQAIGTADGDGGGDG
jgi:hypothetical protein